MITKKDTSDFSLKYGDKVLIGSSKQEKSSYLAAKSIHSPIVYFLRENRPLYGISHFYPGIDEMVFELTPRLYFEAHETMKNTKKTDPKYGLYLKRKNVEDKLNHSILVSTKGKPVLLGDRVQLYHPATGLYVRLTSSKSSNEQFNLMALDEELSIESQFTIKSDLTFRKDGAEIYYQDNFYLVSSGKTLAYPVDERMVRESLLQFKTGPEHNSFENRHNEDEGAKRFPHAAEIQTLMTPVLAANRNVNMMGEIFSNKFNAIKFDLGEEEEFGGKTTFKWGDNVQLAKLDDSGLENWLFASCNLAAVLDFPMIKYSRKVDYNDLDGQETMFRILPRNAEDIGKPIEFDDNNQVEIYLRHVLTGKFVFFDESQGFLKFNDDYGKYFDFIERNKSVLKSEYESNYERYRKILKSDAKDKDLILLEKFSASQISLFKEHDTILSTEEEYIEQYLRDIALVLTRFSQGESNNLQTSSYFSISTFKGKSLKTERIQDKLDQIITDQQAKIQEKFFSNSYNIQEFYDFSFVTSQNAMNTSEFFYFATTEEQELNPTVLDYPIRDLIIYLENDEYNAANLTNVNVALEFLLEQLAHPHMSQIDFQNYIRENCLIDTLMKLFERLYYNNFILHADRIHAILNRLIEILKQFIRNNQFSAEYLYQWKDLFKEYLNNPRRLSKNEELISLVSSIFENTGNYNLYLKYNLKTICERIEFKNFNRKSLKEFLQVLKTNKKMKNSLNDEYILEEVIFSKNKDKIFKNFEIGKSGDIQVRVSKAMVLTLDVGLEKMQAQEANYIIDLTLAAAVLIEIAPNRVASRMSQCYPKEVCLRVATNKQLTGAMRGAFIKVYKSLYIMGEIPKYDLTNISSNILVKKKDVEYLGIQDVKIDDLREQCFENEKLDILGLILMPIDTENSGLTTAIIDIAKYCIENRVMKEDEIEKFELNLKTILKQKGIPSEENKGEVRKMSNKESLITMMSLNQEISTRIEVSTLQAEKWMPMLISCLIEIENYKNEKRWRKFCLKEAVSLRVNLENLQEKYKKIHNPEQREQLIKDDRKRLKNFMDDIQSSDLETPRILLELINPEKPELSYEVFRYLNLLLRRDELTLANYKYKFSIPKNLTENMKNSFLELYELSYRSAGEAFKLERAIEQKENGMVQTYFSEFVIKLREILQKIYLIINEGDQMKKIEANMEMYAHIEVDKDRQDFSSEQFDFMGKEPKEDRFYFNILNFFLGHTVQYKFRRTIFIDLQLPVNILEVLLRSDEFATLHKKKLVSVATMSEKAANFQIDRRLILGAKFDDVFSQALVKGLLILCYIFIKPSSYNKEYIKENHESISTMLKNVMLKGNQYMKLLYLKFLVLLIKDNMSVLVKINSSLIKDIIREFEKSLEKNDNQMIFAFLEIFNIFVEFRGVNFVENSLFITSELVRIFNQNGSNLDKILMTEMPQWLEDNNTKNTMHSIDFLKYRWEKFYSRNREENLLTREHKSKFKVADIDPRVVISCKVYSIFKVVLQNDDPQIFEMVKNIFSLGYLLEVNRKAQDWWPLKKEVIDLITVLYVSDKISEGNFDALLASLENEFLAATIKFDKFTQNSSLSRDEIMKSDLMSIISTPLEQSCYKPFTGQLCYNKSESLKDFVINGLYNLMSSLFKTMNNSPYLEHKNFGLFKSYLNLFSEGNRRNGMEKTVMKAKRKRNKLEYEIVDRRMVDGFNHKFMNVEDVGHSKGIEVLRMMTQIKNDFLVYRQIFSKKLIYNQIKEYKMLTHSNFENTGSGSEDLLQIKDELISTNFLDTVNDEDYNEYIDSILNVYYDDKTKWYFFLSDLIALLQPRSLQLEELERIINIIQGLIELSQDPTETINLLGKMGMFSQITSKYVDNKRDPEVCLLLAKFTILCMNKGKETAQETLLEALKRDTNNSYIVAVKENLASSFMKFYQRETLRSSFTGKELVSQQLKHDLNGPVEDSAQFFVQHLEMLRYFCEGHYLPMQNYLREQADGEKHMPNQVNFLQEVEEHLRLYSKIMAGTNSDVGLKILEFFVELLQGPCYHNQVEVCKLKVIETLEEMCTTLIFFSYTLKDDVKSSIINQIVLILMSTLESNRETLTVSKVSLNVNTDALWERLIQIYCIVMDIEDQYSNPILEKYRKSKSAAQTMKLFVKNKKSINTRKNLENEKSQTKPKKEKDRKKALKIYTDNLRDYSQICYEGLNISILFKLIMDFGEVPRKNIEDEYILKTKKPHLKDLPQKSREFFFSKIRSIEIINQKGDLERVYYQIPAIIRFYSKYSKDRFEEQVDRKSANSKLEGLVKLVPLTLYESKYFTRLSQTGFSVNLNLVRNFRYVNFIWAFLVNLIMILFEDVDDEQISKKAFKAFGSLTTVEKVLFWLTLLLALFYVITLVVWLLLQFSIEKYEIILDEKENTMKEDLFDFEEEDDSEAKKKEAEKKQALKEEKKKEWENTLKQREKKREVNDIDDDGEEEEELARQEKLEEKRIEEEEYNELIKGTSKLRIWWRIFSETYLFLLILFIVSTILGLTVSKIFLSFLLLDIISLSPDLKNVMRAFTMKIGAIGITFIFGIIQIFIYTSVTYFSRLRQFLTFIDSDELEMCENFFHCFMMTLNFGMRSGGGIGEALLYPQYVDEKRVYLIRSVFDMIFFLTIIIMLLEMIFGLIVDSFGELREIRNTTRKAQSNFSQRPQFEVLHLQHPPGRVFEAKPEFLGAPERAAQPL